MRFIMPIILIGIAVTILFVFASPFLGEISELNAKSASYDEALGNSLQLEKERDKLSTKYNSIPSEDLQKLSKFLPENVDNIRLILEIEKIASPYGMALKDVKYNADEINPNTSEKGGVLPAGSKSAPKDYGIFDLEFSTTGTYKDFLNFTRDLERNLRIVDISSVSFTSNVAPAGGSGKASTPTDVYKYVFKIKTYWLKN